MANPLLRVDDIRRSVVGRTLFRDLSFDLYPKQCLVLKGPSGSGKTLLLRTIVGLERLEAGRIACFGEDSGTAGRPRLRARMMLVPQSAHLSGRAVEDVLRAPFELDVHANRSYDPAEAEHLAVLFGRGDSFPAARIDDLSGGERQIVALIRALLLDPSVLLLDEPTAHLDTETTRTIESVVGDWIEDGGAAIWTTHSADQAERVRRGGSIDLSTSGGKEA